MFQIQYDLFEEIPDEVEILRKEVRAMKESQDKQRKSLFAKQTHLMKMIIEMKEEIHRLGFARVK